MDSKEAFYRVPLHTQTTKDGAPLHTYRWLNTAGQHRNDYSEKRLTIRELQAMLPEETIAPQSIEKLRDYGVAG